MADLSLVFDLLARDRASDKVDKVGDAFQRGGRESSLFGKAAGLAMAGVAAAAVGVVGVGAALFGMTQEAAESAKISRLTEAAVASTGGAAKISADQIGDLATALSNKTAIDDEAIQSASNLLLTFTNIRNEAGAGNDIFNQATEAALNMSTAMGTDANAAAMQLGKALNDPIKGVAALGKAGVQFTKEQKEQIKTMVESGNVMGAQQMILKELNTQFGGAAAAAADPMARLTVIAGNLGERIGGALLPYAEAFATWMADKGVPYIERLIGQFETHLPPAIDAAVAAFSTARDVLTNDVLPALQSIGRWIGDNRTTLTVLAGVIGGVLAAAFTVWAVRATIAAVSNAAAWISVAVAGNTGAAATRLSALQVVAHWTLMAARALVQGAVIATVWTVQLVGSAIAGAARMAFAAASFVASWTLMAARALVQGLLIATVWTAQIIASAAVGAASFAVQAARVVAGWVLMGVQSMIQAARMAAAWFVALGPIGWVTAAVIAIVALIIANWDRVVGWTKAAWSAVSGVLTGAWNAIRNIVSSAAGVVVGLITGAWNAVRNGVTTAWNGIRSAVSGGVSGVISYVAGMPGRILHALGNLGSLLYNAGRSILTGLLNGIKSMWNSIKSTLSSLTDMLPDWKGPASRDRSILYDSGRLVMQGFEEGLTSKFGDVRGTLGSFTGDLAGVDATVGAAGGAGGLGYAAPRYDMAAGGAAAAAAPASRVVNVSGVASPETVAAIVRREQAVDEFLAGAGAW